MKNGYTPKAYAYAIAINVLNGAIIERYNDPQDVTPSENRLVIDQLRKLRERLATDAKLDYLDPTVKLDKMVSPVV